MFDDPRGKNSDWRTGNEFGLGGWWVNWLVMREGPKFFAKAWTSRQGNEECVKLITSEWSKRSKEQVLIERTSATEVYAPVLTIGRNNGNLYRDLMDWAKGGREIERAHPDVFFHLGRRLPYDVIRSIEQDYSDYSS